MPTPGPQFQPVLPGMGRVRRTAPKAVPPVTPHAVANSGPMPGQLVMGVKDLARGRSVDLGFHRVPITSGPMAGGTRIQSKGSEEHPYELDPHGYVQEGYGPVPHHDATGGGVHGGLSSASDLYGTHGGRYAKTVREATHDEGSTPSDMGITAGTMRMHDSQVREVRQHWNRQPLMQFPTSQLVHSTQGHEETEGAATEQRTTNRPARGWRAATDSPSGLGQRYATLKTAGGSPQMRTAHTDVTGSGEGRKRIEAIKADLAKGGKIRKPIWMTKVNGRYFQLDGHHRMVAAREMGLSHVPVRLWDQDAERA